MGWQLYCKLFWHLVKKEKVYNFLPSLACWFIWMEQNKCIFDSHVPSIQGATLKLTWILENLFGMRSWIGNIPRIKNTHAITLASVAWFDGETQENGLLSGAGGVIKKYGNIYYKWTLNRGLGTNTRVKLLGVWASLILATQLDII